MPATLPWSRPLVRELKLYLVRWSFCFCLHQRARVSYTCIVPTTSVSLLIKSSISSWRRSSCKLKSARTSVYVPPLIKEVPPSSIHKCMQIVAQSRDKRSGTDVARKCIMRMAWSHSCALMWLLDFKDALKAMVGNLGDVTCLPQMWA